MSNYTNDTELMLLATDNSDSTNAMTTNTTKVSDTVKHDDVGLDVDVVNKINEEANINNELKESDVDGFDMSVDIDNLMLSTIDNPFNPKTQYEAWKRYDEENGYNTESYIARLVLMEGVYDIDDEFLMNVATSKVIEEILENDDQEIYYLV